MVYKKFTLWVLGFLCCGSGLFAQSDQIDRFDGSSLNSRWVTTLTTKGGGSYRQTNGALNFTVAAGSTNRVENNIHVLNTNTLPTDRSWTLVIGLHNSTDFSPAHGASQLQLGIFDARTISLSNTLGVGFTLARYHLRNNGDPLFGFGGTNLPKWHSSNVIWTNASSNASAKFVYDASTRTLEGYVTTDGTNPADNDYNYSPAGPASSISIPASAKLNFYVIQNVYSVAVPVGRMWVDNYKLSFAPLEGRLYPGLPATLSRRPGQDLFLSVSPRDRGTFTYEWRRNGAVVAASSLGAQLYFKGGLTPADAGTYSVLVRRNGTPYATNQTVLTVTNTAPGPAGGDDFSTSSTRWSGVWGFDAHDSYLEVSGGRLDYVFDKSGSENSQAFQIWDNRLPSSQNWEVVIDSFIEPTLNPDRFFALRLDAAVPVNSANGFAALNGLNVSFANSVYGGGRKIQNIKTIPTGDGWLELGEPPLNPSTTNVALRITWNAGTRVLTSFYDTNGATGGYVWTQSATNNLSALPASQLAAGFYAFLSGIAEPSFLLPAGQAYFKNFAVRTGPTIPLQMPPQTVAQGGEVTFTAPGEGTEPITYQWRKNGVAIDGQTNPTLTLSSLTGADSGQYSVFISNALGTITSSNALLTVIVPPGFPAQATNGLRGNLGSAFRYQPTVTGSAAIFTSSNLPPGLTVNRTNGLITGTPTAAGYHRSGITASNFAGTATLSLNFTVPGTRQTLPFSEDFSRFTANRFLAVNFSRTNLEARHATTNNRLQFSALSNALAQDLFPEPIPGLGKAVAAYIANLALPTTQPWMVEADLGISGTGLGGLDPGQGLAGLDIFVDTTNRPIAEGLTRRLNFFIHDWSDSRQPSVSVNGANDDVDGEYEPSLTNWPTSSAKARLVLGISGTNRLLTAWATEDLAGRTGWQKVGKTLELNPAGTTNSDHHPLGQIWNLTTNEVFSLALFGQFDKPGQATWIDNVRVSIPLPPAITSTTNLVGQVGRAFSYAIAATNSPISYGVSNLPAGLELNASTGLITGTPSAAGSNNVVLLAHSPAGTGRRTNVAVILPEFTSSTSVSGFVNDAGLSHQVVVGTHNFSSNLRFSAAGLPTGMNINASNGLISGRPTVAGSFPATVTITALGASASQRVEFTIQGAAGGAFSLTLNPRPTNVLNLPVGLTYAPRTGVISGTPQGWGGFTATGQLSNGTTTNISIPVMPSVPVIAGPTNWNAQVGQPASYQIVAGGFGREWAGFDDFSSNGSKWILSGSRGTTLLVTNGALLNRSTQATDSQDGLAYWQRLMPRTANWEIWMRAFLPTNLLPSNAPSAQNFKLGLFLLNQARNNGQVWEARHYFSDSRYVAQYKRLNNLADSTKLDVVLAEPQAEYDLTMKFTASNGVLRGFVFDGAGDQIVNQTLPLPAGLGDSFSPGIISECNNSTLNPTSAFSADDFLILPDPDDIEYRAFLVGTNTLPEGLEVDRRTGLLAGVIPTNVPAGIYRLRVEAEYLTNNLPLQGLPAVRGGTNVTLTLLPAFIGTNAATFLLNTSNRTHTVDVSTNTLGSSLRFSATGLPAGLVMNATSGVISGRPTAVGTFSPRVTITAGTATAFQNLLLSVHNGDGNRWAVGSPVSYQVNLGAGVTGYQATGLPTGLSINASSGLISGTPTQAGEFNVTVSVPVRGLSTVIPFFIRPIYVNLAATGANNGTTWADAYTNLQTAINAAGAGAQIWVAAGTYKPSQYLDPKVTSDPRSRSFLLKGGVSVLGGFAGTETQLAQRDVDANATILSGDFNGNDSNAWPPVVGNNGNAPAGDATRNDNAYHVVGALGQTTAPVLDGFTITGGNANNVTYLQPNNGFIIPGGIPLHSAASAIAVVNSDFVLRNAHLIKNNGKEGPVGIFNLTGQLRRVRIADSVFATNLAYYGKGAGFSAEVIQSQNVVSRPLLQVNVVRSAFLANEARTGPDEDDDLYPDGGEGGAASLYWGVEGNFVNCAFIDNYANGKKADGTPWYDTGGREGNGGAIQARRYCDLNIANSVFAGNLCDDNGGAINIESGVRLKMYFSTFYDNDSTGNERGFGAGVVFGWYGATSLRPNTVTGYGILSWQNPPIDQEIDLNQGDWVWSPSSGTWIAPPLPAPSTLSQSVFSTATSLTNNTGTLRNGNPNFAAADNLAGTDGLYLTADDGLQIRSGSIAQNFVTSARPNDFADLDEDGNTTELLPFDAAGVAYPANPPYSAGAYQTIAP